jgi:hypothetical protein
MFVVKDYIKKRLVVYINDVKKYERTAFMSTAVSVVDIKEILIPGYRTVFNNSVLSYGDNETIIPSLSKIPILKGITNSDDLYNNIKLKDDIMATEFIDIYHYTK